MKILVTGGAGFIGSNIVDEYIELGHKVVVVDSLYTGKRENINPNAKFYKVDIRDRKGIEAIFKKEKPELVSHHAAQMDVRKSVSDPIFDADVNVLGALNIIENSVKNGVRKIVYAASGGTAYGECGKKAPDESSPCLPDSPYGVTKRIADYYLRYYNKIYGIDYTVLRYGNVYGPRQDPHGEAGVVAIFSEKLLKNENVVIYGDGKQMRDYVYVKDVVRANVLALKKGNNEIINIGTGVTTSVNQLFSFTAAICGYNKKPSHKPKRPGELFKSVLCIDKAERMLGWKPEVAIRTGLRETIQYFRTKGK
jgi:UDP-glucose 4-epimerase